MRGRRGGRIGIPLGPLVGKANGVWHLAEVLLFKKAGGWPAVTTVSAGRDAPAVVCSPTTHITFEQVKVTGGSLA